MDTDVYKSKLVPSAYLFVRKGSSTDKLPQPVIKQLGSLQYFKSISLVPGSPLIAADPVEVINNIKEHSYHLQGATVCTTTKESDVSEVGAAVGGGILAASLGLGPIGAIAGAVVGLWLASQSNTEEEK